MAAVGLTAVREIPLGDAPAIWERPAFRQGASAGRSAVGVGYSPDAACARGRARACLARVSELEGRAWDFGPCIESQFEFCLEMSRADYGVYVGGEGELHVTRREGPRFREEVAGCAAALRNLPKLYPFELMKLCDAPLEGLPVSVECVSPAAKALLEDVLQRLGCRLAGGDAFSVRLSPDGKRSSLSGRGLFLSETQAALCAAGRCVPLAVPPVGTGGGPARDGLKCAVKLLSLLADQLERM